MNNKKHRLAFMVGLAAALSLSAAFSRSSILQGLSAPLSNPVAWQAKSAEKAVDVYTIPWYTIDSGGGAISQGTSAGGDSYTLSGAIGQPDAQATPMAGGVYAVTGGYWQKNMSDWRVYVPLIR